MLTFAYPWLLLLIALPLVVHWLLPAYRYTKSGAALALMWFRPGWVVQWS